VWNARKPAQNANGAIGIKRHNLNHWRKAFLMKIEIDFKNKESLLIVRALEKAQPDDGRRYPLDAKRVRLAARNAEDFLYALRIPAKARVGCRLQLYPPMVMKGLPFEIWGTAAVLVREKKWYLTDIIKQKCIVYALGQAASAKLIMSDNALDAIPAERKIYY
jgi:hypothetical protein